MRLGVIGGGRAGWAFGSNWRGPGRELAGFSVRPGSSSRAADLLGVPVLKPQQLVDRCDVLFLAVSDSAIADVFHQLSLEGSSELAVFHASGSLTSALLAPQRTRFSLHPLMSLPAVGRPVDFAGRLFVYEGTDNRIAEEFIAAMRARSIAIDPEQKMRYHAAAVFASNYVATVLEIADEIFRSAGIRAEGTRHDLRELAESAIHNWSSEETGSRFTGPVARADASLIESHVDALGQNREIAELYLALARKLTAILREQHPERVEYEELFARLSARSTLS